MKARMTSLKFEVEGVFMMANVGPVVLARLLTNTPHFRLTDDSMLGNTEIIKRIEMPRSIDENGEIKLDLFVFRLVNEEDKDNFSKSALIELTAVEILK